MEKIYFMHDYNKQYCKCSDFQDVYNTIRDNYCTIAYRQIDDKTIEYGYAVCNKDDRYNKRIGREIALKYLNEKNKHYRVVHLEDVIANMDSGLHINLFSILDFYNFEFFTFNHFYRWRIERIISEDYEQYIKNKPNIKMHLKPYDPNNRIGHISVLHTFDRTSQPRRKYIKSLSKEDVLKTRQRNYTIAYRFIDENRIEYAVAICHPDDNFEKKIGRTIARKYLNDHNKTHIANISANISDFLTADCDYLFKHIVGLNLKKYNISLTANMYKYSVLAAAIRRCVELNYED